MTTMKTIEQYVPLVLFLMPSKVVPTFESASAFKLLSVAIHMKLRC